METKFKIFNNDCEKNCIFGLMLHTVGSFRILPRAQHHDPRGNAPDIIKNAALEIQIPGIKSKILGPFFPCLEKFSPTLKGRVL